MSSGVSNTACRDEKGASERGVTVSLFVSYAGEQLHVAVSCLPAYYAKETPGEVTDRDRHIPRFLTLTSYYDPDGRSLALFLQLYLR